MFRAKKNVLLLWKWKLQKIAQAAQKSNGGGCFHRQMSRCVGRPAKTHRYPSSLSVKEILKPLLIFFPQLFLLTFWSDDLNSGSLFLFLFLSHSEICRLGLHWLVSFSMFKKLLSLRSREAARQLSAAREKKVKVSNLGKNSQVCWNVMLWRISKTKKKKDYRQLHRGLYCNDWCFRSHLACSTSSA